VTTRQRREVTNFNRFQIHDWAKNMYKCRGWQKMRLLLMIFFFNPPVQSSSVRLAHNTNFGDEVRHNDNFLHKFENCQEKNKYSISIQRDPVKCEKALNGLLNKKPSIVDKKELKSLRKELKRNRLIEYDFLLREKDFQSLSKSGPKKVHHYLYKDCVKALNKLMRNLNNYDWENEKSLKSLSRLIGKNFDHWSEKNYKNNNFFSRFPKEYSISKKPTLYIDTSYFTSRKKKCKFSDLHRRGQAVDVQLDWYIFGSTLANQRGLRTALKKISEILENEALKTGFDFGAFDTDRMFDGRQIQLLHLSCPDKNLSPESYDHQRITTETDESME